MSQPKTEEEFRQHDATTALARPTENVVSTACWECGARFAVLASYGTRGWLLRCTLCGAASGGTLKEATHP